jgi:hypothetical protein
VRNQTEALDHTVFGVLSWVHRRLLEIRTVQGCMTGRMVAQRRGI